MAFQQAGGLRYFQFDSFARAGVIHGIFTRRGGVSAAPWTSLNVGGALGDVPEHTRENRRRIFDALDRPFESVFDGWQVHGVGVLVADAPRPLAEKQQPADILLTAVPAVTLFMRFADCVPIFLYDGRRKVGGIAHAGWQGTVKKAAAAAVQAMRERFGSRPEDILAGIGPSIGPDHYEVRADVIDAVKAAFGPAAEQLLTARAADRARLDLWTANRLALEEAGVEQVETAGVCTACHLDDWYSHRREAGQTGRFGALLALPGRDHGTQRSAV